jgi:hypothetical protein
MQKLIEIDAIKSFPRNKGRRLFWEELSLNEFAEIGNG